MIYLKKNELKNLNNEIIYKKSQKQLNQELNK